MDQVYDQAFFQDIVPASLQAAEIVVPILIDLVQPQSVIDVGCGTGAFLSVFKKNGVKTIFGVDGALIDDESLLVERGEFMTLEFSHPFSLATAFDLCLCLEVAEHIPARSARDFVASLSRLAPVVCFSAAVPAQGGIKHVNEQWPDYWENLFREFGFVMLDPVRPRIWQDSRIAWYYRQNCFLFVRQDLVDASVRFQALAEAYRHHGMVLLYSRTLANQRAFFPTLRQLSALSAQAIRRIMRKRWVTSPSIDRCTRY